MSQLLKQSLPPSPQFYTPPRRDALVLLRHRRVPVAGTAQPAGDPKRAPSGAPAAGGQQGVYPPRKVILINVKGIKGNQVRSLLAAPSLSREGKRVLSVWAAAPGGCCQSAWDPATATGHSELSMPPAEQQPWPIHHAGTTSISLCALVLTTIRHPLSWIWKKTAWSQQDPLPWQNSALRREKTAFQGEEWENNGATWRMPLSSDLGVCLSAPKPKES